MLTHFRWVTPIVCCGLCGLLAGFARVGYSQEKSDLPAAEGKPAVVREEPPLVPPATVKATRQRLVTSVTLKGTLESESATPISIRQKGAAGPLEVEFAVEHGTRVKKGDRLLAFDTEKLAETVADAREDREIARLSIALAELELPVLKQLLPIDLAAGDRAARQSAQDLERFLTIDKARQIADVRFSLKNSEFNVETARDELQQLEAMYKDKDLTEETEKVILRRYTVSLENAQYLLENSRENAEESLTITIPRREQALQQAAAKAQLEWQKDREQLPLQVRLKELSLEKMKLDDKRAQKKLAELEHDLQQLTIVAPTDGIVYYGRALQGQWSGPPATSYLKGGTLPANEVVLTIVGPGQLVFRAEAEEKEVDGLRTGQTARISPTRSPQRRLDGRVRSVAEIPQGGKFDVLVELTGEIAPPIVAGLTGSVRIVTSDNANALTVPSSAVFEDDDTETHHVFIPGPKPQKKVVQLGQVVGDKTEILAGLSEGEEILATKP